MHKSAESVRKRDFRSASGCVLSSVFITSAVFSFCSSTIFAHLPTGAFSFSCNLILTELISREKPLGHPIECRRIDADRALNNLKSNGAYFFTPLISSYKMKFHSIVVCVCEKFFKPYCGLQTNIVPNHEVCIHQPASWLLDKFAFNSIVLSFLRAMR